jgi:serine phosphatase RsbU (regulator of sigma subunit)
MGQRKLRFHHRLGVQMGLAVALVTAVVFGATGWSLVRNQRETLTRELTLRVLVETRSLALAACAPLLRHDPELGLHPFILKALAETPGLVDLVVLDAEGVIQGHRDLLRVGERYDPATRGRPLVLPLREGEHAWLDGNEVVIAQPILHLDRPIGLLVARATRAGIERTVAAAGRHLAVVAAAGTLLAILAVLLLVATHLRPLDELSRGVVRLGSGDLHTRVQVRSRNELGMLGNLVNSMAEGLQRAQDERIKQGRMEHELEIARELQSMLLPRSVSPPPGYEIHARYCPALEVSGDYYDVIPLDDRFLALTAADVSGKGVPGLVVMAMLRVILQGIAPAVRDPVEALAQASGMLSGSMKKGMFVTCIYGVLDTRSHTLVYASAGHCPPALFGPKGARWLPAGGKAIGMFPPEIFRRALLRQEARLEPGEGLLLYTDGLVEAMDEAGGQLGFDVVLQRLSQNARLSAREVVDDLVARAASHTGAAPASDDLTLLAVRRGTGRFAEPIEASVSASVFAPTPAAATAEPAAAGSRKAPAPAGRRTSPDDVAGVRR